MGAHSSAIDPFPCEREGVGLNYSLLGSVAIRRLIFAAVRSETVRACARQALRKNLWRMAGAHVAYPNSRQTFPVDRKRLLVAEQLGELRRPVFTDELVVLRYFTAWRQRAAFSGWQPPGAGLIHRVADPCACGMMSLRHELFRLDR